MPDIGYYTQLEPGIYGTAAPPATGMGGIAANYAPVDGSPDQRAALQQAAFAQNQAIKETAVSKGIYVPPGTGNGPQQPEWASQAGGPANLPVVGWTAQKNVGQPFVAQPGTWTAVDMGTVPDWTSDPNPAAAGSYDMTSPPVYGDFQRADELQGATANAGGGPVGSPFFDAPGAQQPDNPNTAAAYSQGSTGQNLEW